MICLTCRTAADQHAPEEQHCGCQPGPGAPCDCQHRTDRYRPLKGFAAIARMYEQLARVGEAQNSRIETALAQVKAMPGDRPITFPRATTED